MKSDFHETFLFLTKLFWKNRVILPAMISVAFFVFNFRWQVEISIQTERIQMPMNVDNDDDDDMRTDSEDYSSNDEYELDTTDESDEH
jgi:hypothetical protein